MQSDLIYQDVHKVSPPTHLIPALNGVLDKVFGYTTDDRIPASEDSFSTGGQRLWVHGDAALGGEFQTILFGAEIRRANVGDAWGQEYGIETLGEKFIH